MTTCRDEILDAAQFFLQRNDGTFTPAEMVAEMRSRGSNYAESTIRTHVTSVMCKDAPVNHLTSYDDLDRVGFAQYRLNGELPQSFTARDAPPAVVEQVLESSPAGSSKVQREAESVVLGALATQLGIELRPERLVLPNGSYVEVDGVSHTPPVLVEVWAHQGAPKVAQRHKVLADGLKLQYASDVLGGGHRKVLCLCDPAAAAPFLGRSWYAGALAHSNIEIEVVEISDELRQRIVAAQMRQYR